MQQPREEELQLVDLGGRRGRVGGIARGIARASHLDVAHESEHRVVVGERGEAGGRTLPRHDPNKRQRVAPPATFLDGVPTLPPQYQRRPDLEAALAAGGFRDLRTAWLWANGRTERTLAATYT